MAVMRKCKPRKKRRKEQKETVLELKWIRNRTESSVKLTDNVNTKRNEDG